MHDNSDLYPFLCGGKPSSTRSDVLNSHGLDLVHVQKPLSSYSHAPFHDVSSQLSESTSVTSTPSWATNGSHREFYEDYGYEREKWWPYTIIEFQWDYPLLWCGYW